MGGMIVADQDKLNTFLSKVDRAKDLLIQAVEAEDSMRAAFAEAEARLIVQEKLDPSVAAYLIRFCDPKVAMIEQIGDVPDSEKVRIVSLALLNGLVPGRDEFGIFSGGKDKHGDARPSKLYIKEAGYRKWFAKLSATPPDVQTGHPSFTKLANGKSVWLVEGSASTTYHGTEYKVTASGKAAIGLPGYDSDNVAGISAKARRRLLQLLWGKVAAMQFEDADDTADAAEQPELPAIEQETDQEKLWTGVWKAHSQQFGTDNLAYKVAVLMRDAQTVEQLDAITTQGVTHQQDRDRLRLYAEYRREVLGGVA